MARGQVEHTRRTSQRRQKAQEGRDFSRARELRSDRDDSPILNQQRLGTGIDRIRRLRRVRRAHQSESDALPAVPSAAPGAVAGQGGSPARSTSRPPIAAIAGAAVGPARRRSAVAHLAGSRSVRRRRRARCQRPPAATRGAPAGARLADAPSAAAGTFLDSTRAASAAFSSGDFQKARAEFERTLQKNADDPEALNGLGLTLERAGDIQGAIARFERATALAGRQVGLSLQPGPRARAAARLGTRGRRISSGRAAVSHRLRHAVQSRAGSAAERGRPGRDPRVRKGHCARPRRAKLSPRAREQPGEGRAGSRTPSARSAGIWSSSPRLRTRRR